MILFAIYFIILTISLTTKAQSVCITSLSEPGQCLPLVQCKIFVNVKKPLPPKALSYIQQNQCNSSSISIDEDYAYCGSRHIIEKPTNAPLTKKPNLMLLDRIDVNIVEDVSNHRNIKLLPTADCGPNDDDKIAFGKVTFLGQFPWMAVLVYDGPDGPEFRCGGSLISSRYVLTAAHCITRSSSINPLISVRLGEHDLFSDKDCVKYGRRMHCAPPVQEIEIEETLRHPNYNKPLFSNDVALIRLKRNAQFIEDNVLPLCLPTDMQYLKHFNRIGKISGWGLTENNSISNILLYGKVTIRSNDECNNVYNRVLLPSQICVGGEEMVDNCSGDSGGPLIFLTNYHGVRYVLVGVVSSGGRTCGDIKSNVGIYTSVAHYMKWILDQMRP